MNEHDCLGDHFKEQIRTFESERDRLNNIIENNDNKRVWYESKIDRLKASLEVEHQAAIHESAQHDLWKMRSDDAEKEIIRLKAELENIKSRYSISFVNEVQADRDLWKSKAEACKVFAESADGWKIKAEKMAEALRRIVHWHEGDKLSGMGWRGKDFIAQLAEESLAEFEEGK